MKSLREYLKESEDQYSRPVRGDNFAINIREECLLETYIVDETDDGIVLHADDKMMGLLESYGFLSDGDISQLEKDIADAPVKPIANMEEDYVEEDNSEPSPVVRAVLHRLLMQHPGVIATHGPDKVMDAVDELADYVNIGPDDEIGYSDITGWTRDVIRMLAELPDEPMDEQGVAEGEDDLVDLGPALRNLTGEFNKFMKHDDRMKTDPAYAKKWNKRYAKYAGSNDHSIYDDPDDDKEQGMAEGFDEIKNLKNKIKKLEKQAEYYSFEPGEVDPKSGHSYRPNFVRTIKQIRELKNQLKQLQSKQGVSEGSADQWYVVPRSSLDYNGNYYGKGNDVSGPFSKVQAKAELHKAHPYDTNWTIVPAVALMNKGVAEGSNPVGLQFDGKYYNKNGKLLGIWDGYVFTLMPEVERWWTKENGPEWVEQIKKKYTQQIQAQRGQQGMDEAKYQGREVPLGKPMKGDVKKSKVYVRGPKGNVVKVNFGQKGMKIKKNIPGRRKNFRARHNCDNPGPRWKARYWSCRAW